MIPVEPAAASLAAEAGPRLAGSRVYYPETLATYAARYGSSPKTLKRWVLRGRYEDEAHIVSRNPIDLPPFHRPIDLPAWCERRGDRPPEWVLRAAHEAASVPAAAPAPAASPNLPAKPPDSAPVPDPPRDFSDLVALDFEANVHQLRLSLAMDARLLDEAKLGTDEALTAKRQRAYRETYDLLRKSESDLLEWQQKNERLVPRDEVRSENTRISGSIFVAVQRLVRNLRPKLSGKTDAEQDALWEAETRRCFVALRDAKFTDHEATLARVA